MNFPRLFASFKFAWKGISLLLRNEQNAWIHLLATLIVITFGFYFHISSYEWLACIICIAMVFSAEGFNTAIEKLVDLVSPEQQTLAGKVKDLAAGAVLIAAIGAAVTGFIIFVPHFLKILS